MSNTPDPIVELPPLNHADSWDDPILFDEIDTPNIPACLLPGLLGKFAGALALATETPEAMSVMAILGVIATALAKRFVISPKTGWYEPINIYTLIALPPGNHKTFVLKSCTEPLITWEREQTVLQEQEIKRLRSEYKTQEKIIDGLRHKAAKVKDRNEQQQLINEIATQEVSLKEPPALPVLFANDATPESLARSVHEQNGRFAIFSDEGGIIETLAGLYSNGIANIDILLKGIDGGDVRVCRKDHSFHLNPYLTIVLTVQPSVIQTMGERHAYLGNGALERFLYVIPKSKLGYRAHDKPSVSATIQQAYSDRIKSLLDIPPLLINNQAQPYILTLSPAALALWQVFQTNIEVQLRPEGKLIFCQGWGAKISGFALRIAGLLHVAEYCRQTLIIAENTMADALKIAEALTEHAIAAYGLMGIDQPLQDAKELFKWLIAENRPSFTKTELTYAMRHKKWGKAGRLAKALAILQDRNLISAPIKYMTRKPTTTYFVHPNIITTPSK